MSALVAFVPWISEPFEFGPMQRALVAGMIVAVICACVGVWVVQRGMAFLGEALGHALLPGVAIAHGAGISLVIGAAGSAAVMVVGVAVVSRRGRVSADSGVGLLFAGMLATGVLIVSRSRNFSGDLTAFLFGDLTAASAGGNRWLAAVAVVVVIAAAVLYRPWMALAFDERKAMTLGLRPGLANVALLALVAVSVVASFRVVGTLLAFTFLVAPPSTALLVVRRVPTAIVVATLFGWSAVVIGLLLSWHARLAAGASLAAVSVAQFFVVLAVTEAVAFTRRRRIGAVSVGR